MASGDDAQSGSDAEGGLWPSADYPVQVERLRAAMGERVYRAELRETERAQAALGQVLGRAPPLPQSRLTPAQPGASSAASAEAPSSGSEES